MRRNFAIVIVLFLLMFFLRELYSITPARVVSSSLFTLLTGFAILTAFFTGNIFSSFSAPRIVGYLFIGMLFGPGVLHIFTHSDIGKLELMTQLALGLITISAGRELRVREILSRGRLIGRVITSHLAFLPLFLGIVIYFFFDISPVLALLVGLILTTASPAVPMAMINEYGVKGIFPQLVLSILILRDVLIIFLFSTVAVFYGGGGGLQPILLLFVSVFAGLVAGFGFAVLMRITRSNLFLFLLFLLILMYQFSVEYSLNYILMTVMFGFAIENMSPMGDAFLEVIESGSLPLYTIFFSLAGASLELDVLMKIGYIALVVVGARLLLLFVATYIPMRKTGSLKYYLFTGFVPQAGVSIGLAMILAGYFPEHKILADLVIASAVLNEIMGPFFFKWGIAKAGSENVSDV